MFRGPVSGFRGGDFSSAGQGLHARAGTPGALPVLRKTSDGKGVGVETTGVPDTSELAVVCGFLRERGNGRGKGVIGGKVDRSFFRGHTLGETGGVVGEILEIERIGKVIGLRFTNLYFSGDITSDDE